MKIICSRYTLGIILSSLILGIAVGCGRGGPIQLDIKPYTNNPAYWQYKGEPILLLGATDDDNLFQMEGLKSHLDELAASGGNYIRNTMSYRDSGNVTPYKKLDNGLFDLYQWSDEFWGRFDSLLKWTDELDIIVQIEVWDRFDYSRDPWDQNPFNPRNNINYDPVDSLFDLEYPAHPSRDLQQFFHTIPGMPLYTKELDRIRKYQKSYIDKMLSYSLQYGNVLYCMNNETTTPIDWGNYWIEYIRKWASEKGKEVYLTDMYDLFYKVSECNRCTNLIANPDFYTFMDISQINSRNFGQTHWDTLRTIIALRDRYPLRPANNTKIYGGGNTGYGSGTNQDGVERFCRNLMGGCAAVRHHRPTSGNGLNERAKASIRSVREVEKYVRFWDIDPKMELLGDREDNEAYISGKEGTSYLVYFPTGGDVKVDLSGEDGNWSVYWINILEGAPKENASIKVGASVMLKPPSNDGWFAVLIPHVNQL